MKTFAKWITNFGILLAVIGVLAAWTLMPWYGLVVLAGLIAMWLWFSRNGAIARAALGIGLSTLPQRVGASGVVIIGIAGVVGVLVAMLALSDGFSATVRGTGNSTTAILIRSGAQSETNSFITRDQVPLVAGLDGIGKDAEGKALISSELSQVVNVVTRSSQKDTSAQLRGESESAWALRPTVRITEGRKFRSGLRELVVGERAEHEFAGLEVGKTIALASQEWTVVGVFASSDAHASELWADADTLAATYSMEGFQSVLAKLDGSDGLKRLRSAIAADPRLKLDANTTRYYYARQSETLTSLISMLGIIIGGIMAVGAVFGALNTMYAAVAGRAREIATMRAIGFRGLPVVVAVMLETLLLALVGGLIGCALAWLIFHGYSVSTRGANLSQIVFQFQVSPELLWTGLKWALGIGLVGGLFPALRAARLPVTETLRGVN